jgi:hypothetical protein
MGGELVLQSHTSRAAPDHQLEELIQRQTVTLEKLQRDGAYTCEIRAAQRMLRRLKAKLQARRAKLATRRLEQDCKLAATRSRQGSAEHWLETAAGMRSGRPSWAGHATTQQEI